MKEEQPTRARRHAGRLSLPDLPNLFTYTQARIAGLSDRRLYELRNDGALIQLGTGLYRWAAAESADLDLLEIAARAPASTLCLETALARHGLLDSIPSRIDVAVSRGASRPRFRAPVRLHSFAAATYSVGRETIDVGAGTPLGIYSPERSIIDAIRLRHQEGPDLAWDALRRWLQRPGRQPAQLLALAELFNGVTAPLRGALEVML